MNAIKRFQIIAQPTETTCGPTCLHAVCHHWGDDFPLETIIGSIEENEDGGTFSVVLANLALRRGYEATIYSYNTRVFDPTWNDLHAASLQDKLAQRLKVVSSRRAKTNLSAYIEFLDLGGNVRFDELSTPLLARLLANRSPIIAGLSATHLYRSSRVRRNGKDDDVGGDPEGHFVVLFDYDKTRDEVLVADPYRRNPLSESRQYAIDTQRLINAVMLGILTYDANLLIIEPTRS